jgi:hypothetical protein
MVQTDVEAIETHEATTVRYVLAAGMFTIV